MRRLLAIIPFAALVLAGCSYQEKVEVVAVEKCSNVMGEKYYREGGIRGGRVVHYFVFDDGREIPSINVRYADGYNAALRMFCQTEFVPKGGKK